MNILFLDYDGVVNTPMWDEKGEKCTYNFPEDGKVNNFQCVQWISEFCEKFGYDIVVSSTWRNEANYKECLINGGLREGIKILGRTPHIPFKHRGNEIQQYLDEHHEVENFIIIDDDDDMLHLSDHLIKCNTNYGFCLPEYTRAEKLHHKLVSKKTTVSYLGVVRNYQGLYKINYLLTIGDFKKKFVSETPRTDFFSTHNPEKDWENFLNELKENGIADWALFNNDTMTVQKIDADNISGFICGDSNTDICEVVLLNIDNESIVKTIERYAGWHWYFDTEESSEEIISWAKVICSNKMFSNLCTHTYTFERIFSEIKSYLNEKEIKECEEYLFKISS